jgi:hypothetical protein
VKRALVTLSVFLSLAGLSQSTPAQEKQLSPAGRKLKEAWDEMQRKPNDPIIQKRYLAAFPHDYKSFLELFDFERELYDEAHEYIDTLPVLARNHEREVGKLLVQLGGDAHYEADAPGYLRNSTSTYGSQHTQMFVRFLKSLPPRKQAQLVAFLADVENPAAYPEYQSIIDHLKVLGDMDVAHKFEVAREKRSSQPNN